MKPISLTSKLKDKDLIQPPKWMTPSTVCYETRSGSHAYGVSNPDSDMDVVGFCVPPKEIVFPHTAGNIHGFGRQKKNFKNFDAQHIDHEGEEYDLTMFNIVEYFNQCMDNNPNWLETLFTSPKAKITENKVASIVMDRRHLFLHKGSFHRFTGFAKSQIYKMKNKTKPDVVDFETGEIISKGNRDDLPERVCKYAYHAVRLLDEVEQILKTGDLVLDNNVSKLREIREGGWTYDQVFQYFNRKENDLADFYEHGKSPVPYRPDEDAIKDILLEALEEHYGNLEGCIIYKQWGS